MQNLMLFKNEVFGEIRIVTIDNEEMFCASDVAKALGYLKPNDAVNQHCSKDGTVKHSIIDSIGRNQRVNFIDESNLYRLIVRSKLPSAKQFEKWVFEDVLPQIRQTGGYIPVKYEDTDQEILARALQIMFKTVQVRDERISQLELQNNEKQIVIDEQKPKIKYHDLILQSKGGLTITQIAKDYGLSAMKLNQILHDLGVQFKQRKVWILYSKYHAFGYMDSHTVVLKDKNGEDFNVTTTVWTQKGRLFIYEKLKQLDILPLVEK